MRKNIKVAAVAAAAALLGLGAAMTSFAYGWVESAGTWHYEDRDGDYVTATWEKSGDNWFYLDDDGDMAIDQLIEYDDNYYYVDANGAMVRGDWRLVEQEDYDEDEEAERYYYFQSNGKAYKNKKADIAGKTYIFDDEGRMCYGWISETFELLTDDDAWLNATYYGGEPSDGAIVKNDWRYIAVVDEDEDENYWFWFQTNGKKFAPESGDKDTKSIKGKTYLFGGAGEMLNEWGNITDKNATPDNAADAGWFRNPYETDGSLVKKGWFKEYPGEYFDKAHSEDGNDAKMYWFYGGTDGKLYTGLRSINGKKYLFNNKGEMQTGLKYVTFTSEGDVDTITGIDYAHTSDVGSSDAKKCVDYYAPAEGKNGMYYFAKPADTDGSMKTGSINVDLDGEIYAMNFTTAGEYKGKGITKKQNNAYYINGMKVVADADMKYEIFEVDADKNLASWDTVPASELITSTVSGDYKGDKEALAKSGNYVVISNKGTIASSGTKKDGDDYRLYIKKGLLVGVQIKF